MPTSFLTLEQRTRFERSEARMMRGRDPDPIDNATQPLPEDRSEADWSDEPLGFVTWSDLLVAMYGGAFDDCE